MPAARRERKVVTVLFADLVGFTSRAEAMDPEDVAAELARYQSHLRAELERFGGTVEKFIGDAVMAVFGAPVAHEDDPERAVRAALEIRDWAREEGVEVRIGVNSGEALVTLDARPEAGETMVAGDVVNTAARLQAAAPVNGVLAGEQTVRATGRAIDYGEPEPVDAKGKAQPVPARPVLQARSRIAVDRVHGATLVGRVREVALLEEALARVIDEASPQLVTLVGVPGIGKSRLVLELFGAVERHPELIHWRQGRCLPYGEGVTFWALGEMVKAQLGILEADEAGEAERKLAEAGLDPWVEGHVRPLVGLSGGAAARAEARDEAFAAWRRFFEELAARRPLVLVFEDLHWADENLLDFVDYLVDWATGVPLLVVGTARPELLARRPGWGGGKLNALTISLSPLGDQDTTRLLHELLGSVLPAETQTELLTRAGGNPLYAEEFARMLRDRAGTGEIPATVQGLIAARLDLLEPEQKALLQDASVIGKRFWVNALGALLGAGQELDERLHALERKEFVRRERTTSVDDDPEYVFRHLLVRDVAYGQIPRADRAAKHLAAAAWIEELGRREDHAEMLAHHYLQALELTAAAGGSPGSFAEAAGAALVAAGDRALALNAYDGATRYYRAALDVLPENDTGRGRAWLAYGRARFLLGETSAAELERARDELVAVGDAELAAEAEHVLAEHLWMAGQVDAAMEALARAQEHAERLGPSPAKVRVAALASRLHMLAGRSEEAVAEGLESLAMADELGLEDLRVSILVNIGTARAALAGETWRNELAAAAEAARAANEPFERARALGNAASWSWMYGETQEALALWEQAREEAEAVGQAGFMRWVRGAEVKVRYELGEWEAAVAGADSFLAEVEEGSPHYLAGLVHCARGLVRLACGDAAGAAADAESAVAHVAHLPNPQAREPALAESAQIYAELGELERAREAALAALEPITPDRRAGFQNSSFQILALAATALGLGDECAAALEATRENPWSRAGIAYCRGEPLAAAAVLDGIQAVGTAAFCRLAAARGGDLSQLEQALAFYRSVGATRYVREAESLAVSSRSA